MENIPILAPQRGGYLGDALTPEAFLSESRNFSLASDVPVRRRGYAVRRSDVTAASFLERIPVDEVDGTPHAAYLLADELYEDKASPALLDTLTVDPYDGVDAEMPSWVYAYARTVLVNGTDWRLLIWDGSSALTALEPLTDPSNPNLGVSGGGSIPDGTWYVRVRWYDSLTGTYSGPNARTASAGSVVTGSGNNTIDVDQPTSPPSRATHWQIQLSSSIDTPSAFEITAETHASGLIPIATATVALTLSPTAGTHFDYRTDGAQVIYRHANPPSGASFVAFHRGRWFYASRSARWLVWSDIGSPEHFYSSPTDPTSGFNTADGDGIGSSLSGACTGLFSNQQVLYFAQRGDIQVCEGSWDEVFAEDGTFISRNGRISPLSTNGIGAVSGSSIVVDQDVYFVSPRGPAVISGGSAAALRPEAIRTLWGRRDRAYDHRSRVSYDPDTDAVVFSLVTQQSPVEGMPELLLAWQRNRQAWCPPWTICTSGLSLVRFVTDAGDDRGMRLIAGSWYGQQLELGVSDGDGWDGSDADAEPWTPDSVTSTSATQTAAGWAADEFAGYGVVLVAPNGTWYPRQIKSNTTDTLTWEGAISSIQTNHYVFLGGIAGVWHTAILDAGEVVLRGVNLVLDDQPSRRGAP